jgi:hypothetical protein
MLQLDPNRQGFMLMQWDNSAEFLFQHIEAFYAEIKRFTEEQFKTQPLTGDEIDALFAAQAAVMPKLDKPLEQTVNLNYDIIDYFKQIKSFTKIEPVPENFQALTAYHSPRQLSVRMRPGRAKTLAFIKMDAHKDEWELISPLRFHQVH